MPTVLTDSPVFGTCARIGLRFMAVACTAGPVPTLTCQVDWVSPTCLES